MKDNKIQILKTLIGSHAHGLAGPDSDYDYKGVYVTPTSEILSLGYNYKGTNWIEGKEDNTSYEIHHFLHLALQCNPTILEVFKAPCQPILFSNENELKEHGNQEAYFHQYGAELRNLFPYVWTPQRVYDAFVGYGLNQRKKMLDNHLSRWNKYGVAYIRTLYNLIDLLKTGTFSLEVPEFLRNDLLEIKNKKRSPGQIIDMADNFTELAKAVLPNCKQEAQPEKVNEFLLKVRREFWE